MILPRLDKNFENCEFKVVFSFGVFCLELCSPNDKDCSASLGSLTTRDLAGDDDDNIFVKVFLRRSPKFFYQPEEFLTIRISFFCLFFSFKCWRQLRLNCQFFCEGLSPVLQKMQDHDLAKFFSRRYFVSEDFSHLVCLQLTRVFHEISTVVECSLDGSWLVY